MILRDFLHNEIHFQNAPKRIVSVVPSQTELLYDLGLGDHIFGVTKFCTFPAAKPSFVKKVGGTKTLALKKILALKPEIVIANKEENDRAQIEELSKSIPCYVSDIKTLEDNYRFISDMGKLFRCVENSTSIIQQIKSLDKAFQNEWNQNFTAVYLIWKEPLMAAGNDTFIHHMMTRFGFSNAIKKSRYPIIAESELKELNPDFILLSDEPFPFKEKHIDYFEKITPESKIVLVNGSYFSWYGSRLIKAFEYAAELRHTLNFAAN